MSCLRMVAGASGLSITRSGYYLRGNGGSENAEKRQEVRRQGKRRGWRGFVRGQVPRLAALEYHHGSTPSTQLLRTANAGNVVTNIVRYALSAYKGPDHGIIPPAA